MTCHKPTYKCFLISFYTNYLKQKPSTRKATLKTNLGDDAHTLLEKLLA